MTNFELCNQEEATHVRITNKSDAKLVDVTFGEVYEYKFDDSEDEMTHFLENDKGELLYDFEVILSCEYLKEIN